MIPCSFCGDLGNGWWCVGCGVMSESARICFVSHGASWSPYPAPPEGDPCPPDRVMWPTQADLRAEYEEARAW